MRLLLASTSPYRHDLLGRLRLPFETASPGTDESPREGESPEALVRRLALGKAQAVAVGTVDSWVIGSDQLADSDGRVLGKPDTVDVARAQLMSMSGTAVVFRTAVAVVHSDGRTLQAIDATTVRFRTLSEVEIARYIDAERPLDCAGSFKAEGLGIALFESIKSSDPTALIGLPLIATSRLLREAGFALP